MPYLLKTEPGTYSFDDLERDGETTWDGISNPTALLNLRSMKPGEKLIVYHSNVGKAAVGTAKVVSVDATNPKDPKVRIQPVKRLKQEKTKRTDMKVCPTSFHGAVSSREAVFGEQVRGNFAEFPHDAEPGEYL